MPALIALVPAILRVVGLVFKYGPTAITLAHQALDLAQKITDDDEMKNANLQKVAAAFQAANKKETKAALKEVVDGLK